MTVASEIKRESSESRTDVIHFGDVNMANVVLQSAGNNNPIDFIDIILDLLTSTELASTTDYIVDNATSAHITYTNPAPTNRTIVFSGTGLNTGSGTITGLDYKLNGTKLFTITDLALSASALDHVVDSYRNDQIPDTAALVALFKGVGWNIDLSGNALFSTFNGTGGNDTVQLGSATNIVYLDGGNDDFDLGAGDDVVYYLGGLGYREEGSVHIDGGTGHDRLTFTEGSDALVPYITEGMTIDLSGPIALQYFTITVENVEQISGTKFADIFVGTNKDEGMGGAGGGDEFTGGGGLDTLYGGTDAEDVFIYSKPSNSVGKNRDVIMNYEHNMDFFDLSRLHPETKNDSFTLVGEDALRKAGDLHFIQHNERGHDNDYTLIEANIDKKGKPDLQIEIHGLVDLTGGDFQL